MKPRSSPRPDSPTGKEMGGRKTHLYHLDEPIGETKINDANDNHNDRFQPRLRLRQPKIRHIPTDGEGNVTNVLSTKQIPQLLDYHRTGDFVGSRHPTFWQSDCANGSPFPSNNGGGDSYYPDMGV